MAGSPGLRRSCRAAAHPRIPTTSVSSICVSSCAAASRSLAAARLAVQICCIRTAPMHERTTAERAHTLYDTASRALQVGKPSRTNLRREIANANRARAAARRLNALRTDSPRIVGRRRIAAARRFLAARAGALRHACRAPSADSLAGRPTLVRTCVSWLAGAPVDSTALHAAIEADGAVVVAELSPFGSGGVKHRHRRFG